MREPKRPIRTIKFAPEPLSDECLKRVGGEMPQQLGKTKPAPERNPHPMAGDMCWETDVTPKPAHSMWDEDAITQRFARRDSSDITQKVVVGTSCVSASETFWARLRSLFARLF
jgi:hypothetical protein